MSVTERRHGWRAWSKKDSHAIKFNSAVLAQHGDKDMSAIIAAPVIKVSLKQDVALTEFLRVVHI